MKTSKRPIFCPWAPADDPLYRDYHDRQWGVPEYDSRSLWEKLQLDGMQAGLAWITILRKRSTIGQESDWSTITNSVVHGTTKCRSWHVDTPSKAPP